MKPFVITTNKCNLNCVYCFYELNKISRKTELNFKFLKQFLVDNADRLSSTIMLTGGEPFIHKEIYSLLEWLCDKGASVEINSNLIDVDLNKIVNYKEVLGIISTSVDSSVPKVHNAFRGGWAQTMSSIDFLVKNNIPFKTTTVITTQNYKQIDCTYDLIDSLNPKTMMLQPVDIPEQDNYYKYSLKKLCKEELVNLFIDLKPWALKYGYLDTLKIMENYYLANNYPKKDCAMGKRLFVIDCDGSIYPCFHRHDLYCGNLYFDDPKKILDNVIELGKKIKIKDCFRECCVPLF